MSAGFKRGLAVVALFFLALPGCLAQRFTFKEYIEGLGDLNVNALLQDRAGFIWLGTENGLYRYDGASFQAFGRAEGLTARLVMALHEDQRGYLWIGTRHGLFFYHAVAAGTVVENGRIAEVRYRGESLDVYPDSSLTSLPNGEVLVAARQGLFAVTSAGGRSWGVQPFLSGEQSKQLSPGPFKSVLATPDGTIVFSCGNGICRLRNSQLTKWDEHNGLPADHWTSFFLDRAGRLWARSLSHAAVLPPGETKFQLTEFPGSRGKQEYVRMTEDRDGNILTPVDSAVAKYENGQWRIFSSANGLSDYAVSSILVDREGTVWLGLIGHGLQKWLGYQNWEHWTTAEGLQSNVIWAILRDRTGRLWVADELGLNYMDPGATRFRHWSVPGMETKYGRALAESQDGYIWLGTAEGNLIQIDRSTLSAKRLKLSHVFRIVVDRQDRVWIATRDSLCVSEKSEAARSFHQIEDPQIKGAAPRDIAEDPEGYIWAASRTGV